VLHQGDGLSISILLNTCSKVKIISVLLQLTNTGLIPLHVYLEASFLSEDSSQIHLLYEICDFDRHNYNHNHKHSFLIPPLSFFPLFSRYIYALCSDIPSIVRTTDSVLRSFAADGVIYLELRTTPRAIPSAHVTKAQYIETILDCTARSNVTGLMKTSLILSIDRSNTSAIAKEVVDLALAYRDQGVVGIDLCGDPARGDVSIFQPAFKRAKEAGLKITLHFAEAPQSSTDSELWTLLGFLPDRIGHVIHVPDDVKQEIVKRGLGVELCLSCNVHAKMITGSFGDHHFGWWWGKGCPVALSV